MATAKYIETVGRRKTASARVRYTPGSKLSLTINGKSLEAYFPIKEHQASVMAPLTLAGVLGTVTVVVTGGGVNGQVEAVRQGLARALIEEDISRRTDQKKAGYLKRDPRAKERRKPGLKKARKSPQWSKR
ncbi:MAG: 30S ribosomal protein S9 [Patescibacteria group bacterium]